MGRVRGGGDSWGVEGWWRAARSREGGEWVLSGVMEWRIDLTGTVRNSKLLRLDAVRQHTNVNTQRV